MRACPVLRSESDVCRSSNSAPPRASVLDSPQSAETSATGESFGKLTLTELDGRGAWPQAAAMPSNANSELFRIHMTDGYLPRRVVHITGADGIASHRDLHVLSRRRPEKLEAVAIPLHADPRRPRIEPHACRRRRRGAVNRLRKALENHARQDHQQNRKRQRRPPGTPPGLGLFGHALARGQTQPDVGAHGGSGLAPLQARRHFLALRLERLAHAAELLHLPAAGAAFLDVPRDSPPRPPAQVSSCIERERCFRRVSHAFLLLR